MLDNYDKFKKLRYTYCAIAITSMVLAIILWMFVPLGEEYTILLLILAIVFTVAFIVSYILLFAASKEYPARYLFLGKKFKNEINTSINRFNTDNKKFLKDYIKNKKHIYRLYGTIDDEQSLYDNWIFKEKDSIDKLIYVFDTLHSAIKSGGGIIEFCTRLDFDNTNIESGWQVVSYFSNRLVSIELRYLMSVIYSKTDFNLSDNGLSSRYTEELESLKQELKGTLDPILLNFKDEIAKIIKKLKDNKENNKSKKSTT